MDSEELFQIAYISDAVIPLDTAVADEFVKTILETSKRNNQRDGLTGALMFSGTCFAQILEGPEDKVNEAFVRIREDARHEGLETVIHEPVRERSFPGWSMAFATGAGLNAGGFDNLHACASRIVATREGVATIEFMERIMLHRERSLAHAEASMG